MIPPPCTCGETATGLVVEGHLHPYCAWLAERARAERYREALVEIVSAPDASKGEGYGCLSLHEARYIADGALWPAPALAADREGRSS